MLLELGDSKAALLFSCILIFNFKEDLDLHLLSFTKFRMGPILTSKLKMLIIQKETQYWNQNS